MRFSDIPGHEDVKARLRRMVDDGHVPHALLLEGPSGTAKFALARALAQYIHCTARTPEGDSCGRCASCRQHQDFNHPDTFYSYPVVKQDGGRTTLSDDYAKEWHQFLGESPMMDWESWLKSLGNVNAQPRIFVDEANELVRRLNLTAMASAFKVVLMWLPERMKEECANKMLKLVEEPYPDTLFIMTTDEPSSILPTIYSRTQRVGVSRYSDSEVAQWLKDQYAVEPSIAADLARLAAGSLNRAIQLMDVSDDSRRQLTLFQELMRKAYLRRVADLKKWSNDIADLGREPAMKFMSYCQRMIRENFILNLRLPRLNIMTKAEAEFCSKFAPYIHENNAMRLVRVFDEATADIAANTNVKMVAFDLAMKICILIKVSGPT